MKNTLKLKENLYVIDDKYFVIEQNIDSIKTGLHNIKITKDKSTAIKWLNILNNCDSCANCNECTIFKILTEIESRCEIKTFYL